MKALELSLQPSDPGSTEGTSSAHATDQASSSQPIELGHWAPHSVADVFSAIAAAATGSLTATGAGAAVETFLLAARGDCGVALVIGGYTVAVARVNQSIYLFDSHGYARVSRRAFCAVFSLAKVGELRALLQHMIRDRLGEEGQVGFTTFQRPASAM